MTSLPNHPALFRDQHVHQVHELSWSHYPNGEPMVKDAPLGYGMGNILLRPRNIEELIVPLFVVEAMQERHEFRTTLVLPCVPGSRQDRLNPRGDALFTLKSVANLVNARNFSKVVIVDPHSDVTPALIKNAQVWTAARIIQGFQAELSKYDGVIAPDGGAVRRASEVAALLEVPLFHGWKQRSLQDDSLSDFGCEKLPPGKYLVVDDLCDGGATFIGLADAALTFPDVKLDLYVTHGLFTKGTADLLTRYGRIYTTDTVLSTSQHDCTVFPVCVRLL